MDRPEAAHHTIQEIKLGGSEPDSIVNSSVTASGKIENRQRLDGSAVGGEIAADETDEREQDTAGANSREDRKVEDE